MTKNFLTLGAFEDALNGGDLQFLGGLGAVGIAMLYVLVSTPSTGVIEVARVSL